MAHQADPLERRAEGRPPVREEVVEDREEALLGRIPRLLEVLVQADLVDRPDRHVGVRVGGEEDPLGIRRQLHGGGQELDAGHPGHPLVDDEQRHRRVAQGQAADRVEGGRAGVGGDDPYSVPKWPRSSRSTARRTAGSSSTTRITGFAMARPLPAGRPPSSAAACRRRA